MTGAATTPSSPELAEEKARAEIAKLQAETAALTRSHWRAPSSWLPLVVGAAGLASALTTCQVTSFDAKEQALAAERRLLTAEKEETKLRGQNDELSATGKRLREEKAQLEATLAQARLAIAAAQSQVAALKDEVPAANAAQVAGIGESLAAASARIAQPDAPVYVQFRGGLTREAVDALRDDLIRQGFRAPGAERVAGTYATEVRFFRPADAARADAVAAAVAAFFMARKCPLPQPPRARQVSMRAPEGSVEVWIAHNCG